MRTTNYERGKIMEEKRQVSSEGRRWYDQNRAAMMFGHVLFIVYGFILGCVVCYFLLGCQPKLPYIPGL
jgi:hypothetical protein